MKICFMFRVKTSMTGAAVLMSTGLLCDCVQKGYAENSGG